jgi:hypothetical protein
MSTTAEQAKHLAVGRLATQGVDPEWAEEHVEHATLDGSMLYYQVRLDEPMRRYFGEFVISSRDDG